MKKLFTSFLALSALISAGAQTYTDITPSKFDFSKYQTGAIDNFWDAAKQVNHAVAGSSSDANGVITVAQEAAFTDGYAYFYFNQPTDPAKFTQIVNVDGVGNVLQFGDAGMAAGFGGCYFVPAAQQVEGLMRTTVVFRKTEGANGSNTGASLNIGARSTAAEGPDLPAVSYTDLSDAAAAGKWYKATVEYAPTYALRINYAQLIWGDNIQIAQVKFETVTDVPEDYEPVKSVVSGAFDELVETAVEPDPTPEPEPEPGEMAYTDITPSKFDFSKYQAGAIDNFWDAAKQVNHAVAGSSSDANGVITVAQEAAFTDGYAYFYFNQPADPAKFTQIVNVDGVGNVLQFGDAGMAAGFGGCYFVPATSQTDGYMRTTVVFRKTDGANGSNTGASLNIGVRNISAEGPDLPAVSYSDLEAAANAGLWHKATIEYCPSYALRINYAQLIWGDNIQIAQVKFEAMENVPKDYEPVKAVISGTPQELGIANGTSALGTLCADRPYCSVIGNTATFSGTAVVYDTTGSRVSVGTSVQLRPGIYIAYVNGRGLKFIIK